MCFCGGRVRVNLNANNRTEEETQPNGRNPDVGHSEMQLTRDGDNSGHFRRLLLRIIFGGMEQDIQSRKMGNGEEELTGNDPITNVTLGQ